jgi:hypothetical protein
MTAPTRATPFEQAELDTSTVDKPMVSVTERLPVSTLNAGPGLAAGRDSKVTALLREWVDGNWPTRSTTAASSASPNPRRLIAHAS